MSNNELCQIPGMKRSAWDPQAGLRLVISLKEFNQSLKPCSAQGMIPSISDQLNQLRAYLIVHSVDVSQAFWQIKLDDSIQENLLFSFLNLNFFNNIN